MLFKQPCLPNGVYQQSQNAATQNLVLSHVNATLAPKIDCLPVSRRVQHHELRH